jgi:hypothetical protein
MCRRQSEYETRLYPEDGLPLRARAAYWWLWLFRVGLALSEAQPLRSTHSRPSERPGLLGPDLFINCFFLDQTGRLWPEEKLTSDIRPPTSDL